MMVLLATNGGLGANAVQTNIAKLFVGAAGTG